jgi:hypothetical protein
MTLLVSTGHYAYYQYQISGLSETEAEGLTKFVKLIP